MKKMGAGRRSRRRSPLRIADPISLRLDGWMAPKYHPTPLSGGARNAPAKELGKARAMANILAAQSVEIRAKAVAHHRPGREWRLPLAGDQVRALQDAARRRSRGDEAPADHVRA